MEPDRKLYKIHYGFLVCFLLNNRIGKDKRCIFQELNNISLQRVID